MGGPALSALIRGDIRAARARLADCAANSRHPPPVLAGVVALNCAGQRPPGDADPRTRPAPAEAGIVDRIRLCAMERRAVAELSATPHTFASRQVRATKNPGAFAPGFSCLKPSWKLPAAGDFEASGEAVRIALVVDVRHATGNASDEAGRRRVVGVLIEKLELEVEVLDGIPVSDAADAAKSWRSTRSTGRPVFDQLTPPYEPSSEAENCSLKWWSNSARRSTKPSGSTRPRCRCRSGRSSASARASCWPLPLTAPFSPHMPSGIPEYQAAFCEHRRPSAGSDRQRRSDGRLKD